MSKIPIIYYRYIPPTEVFWIDEDMKKRFSKEDQKFLRKNKSFFLDQLSFPIVKATGGAHYYVEQLNATVPRA